MPALMIREDLSPGELRRLVKTERDLRVARHLLAIAAVHNGLSREAVARVVGMDQQTLRDWATILIVAVHRRSLPSRP
jgi:hypothetical protein